jgi:hypothetical protein
VQLVRSVRDGRRGSGGEVGPAAANPFYWPKYIGGSAGRSELAAECFVLPAEDVDRLREVAGRLMRESPQFQAVVREFGGLPAGRPSDR